MTPSVRIALLCAGLFAAPSIGALAQTGPFQEVPPLAQRPFAPGLTCGALRSIVAHRGHVVVASSPTAYETVHFESGACQNEVSFAPAFEPTLDEPYCFAGYRCVQRNNGENSVR